MATREFEPRSAKSAGIDEITFSGTEDKPWREGDEIPPGAEVVDMTDDVNATERKLMVRRTGVQITLKAKDGVFQPRNAEEDRALAAFGLPVARTESKSSGGDAGKGS